MHDESLLDQAVTVFFASKRTYRDGMLETGRLVRSYLAINLAAAAALNEAERHEAELTRSFLTANAARKLKVPRSTVNLMIHTCAAVELLSDAGQCGNLSWSSLRALRVLVEHPPGEARRSRKEGGLSVADKEQWRVKEPVQKHIDLFRRAVAEGWDSEEVASAMPRCCKGPKKRVEREADGAFEEKAAESGSSDEEKEQQDHRTRVSGTISTPKTVDLFALARNANAPDLAGLITELINNSREKERLVELLREQWTAAAR